MMSGLVVPKNFFFITSMGVYVFLNYILYRRMSIVQIAGVELLSRMLSLEVTRRAVPSSRAKVLYVCVCVYAQCVYRHIYIYTRMYVYI